jgi:dethiobiotin synthetase
LSVVIVSGTGTDVGKTVATAALASVAAAAGKRVAVVKPAQTGVAIGEPGDLAEVSRLSGVSDVHEFARFPDPLSPHHAALMADLPPLGLLETVRRIRALDADRDLVLVEGAGGLLVPYSEEDLWTVVDLARELDAPILLVTAAGLGTINHTALSVEYVATQQVGFAGIIIGSWPAEPDLAMRRSLIDLARMAPEREIAGVLPAGMATVGDFAELARAALAPHWDGTFQWRTFVADAV